MRFVSLTDLGRYDLYSSPARFLREDLHREITELPGHHVNRAKRVGDGHNELTGKMLQILS